MLVFMCGFVLWQPIGYFLFHILPRRPQLLTSEHDWIEYLVFVAALTAIAGPVWYFSRTLPSRSWSRSWIDWGLWALALGSILEADNLPTTPWFISAIAPIVAAVVTGVLLGTVARYVLNAIRFAGTR